MTSRGVPREETASQLESLNTLGDSTMQASVVRKVDRARKRQRDVGKNVSGATSAKPDEKY